MRADTFIPLNYPVHVLFDPYPPINGRRDGGFAALRLPLATDHQRPRLTERLHGAIALEFGVVPIEQSAQPEVSNHRRRRKSSTHDGNGQVVRWRFLEGGTVCPLLRDLRQIDAAGVGFDSELVGSGQVWSGLRGWRCRRRWRRRRRCPESWLILARRAEDECGSDRRDA